MTLKYFLLQIIFVFIFSACTLSGDFDDESFQAEEEEYIESQSGGSQVALENGSPMGEMAGDELGFVGEDIISGEVSGDFGDSLPDEFDTASTDNLVNVDTAQTKKTTWIPLKKIPTQPWKHDGKWVNAVYIARDGEDLNQISVKIYGSANLTDELKNFNPFLKRRDPKVGDKIYYNSPNRPNDGVKFSHYYEDNNQTAMTHDIQAGENIRTIATQLLGHKDSWKEIWATNLQVESKWIVNETVTVYYWPGSAAQVVESPPPEILPEPEKPVLDLSDSDPAEMPEEPPTLDGGVVEDVAMMPEEEVLQPPSPPKPDIPPDIISGDGSFVSKNASKIKVIAIIGVLLILAAFFIRMVLNRKNRADFDFSQTHIDIDNIEE